MTFIDSTSVAVFPQANEQLEADGRYSDTFRGYSHTDVDHLIAKLRGTTY